MIKRRQIFVAGMGTSPAVLPKLSLGWKMSNDNPYHNRRNNGK